jgi:hypothetical protein
MNEFAVYRQMIEQGSGLLRQRIDEFDDDSFGRRPGPSLNPASFIYFHVLRHWERDINWVCKGQGLGTDLWARAGIGERMGYDPIGIGWRGVGTGYGYSDSEVDAVPPDRETLNHYHDLLRDETWGFMATLNGQEDLDALIVCEHFPDQGYGYSIRERHQHLILHTGRHTGDIAYVKGALGQPDATYGRREEVVGSTVGEAM